MVGAHNYANKIDENRIVWSNFFHFMYSMLLLLVDAFSSFTLDYLENSVNDDVIDSILFLACFDND